MNGDHGIIDERRSRSVGQGGTEERTKKKYNKTRKIARDQTKSNREKKA